jgi:hypothetical protein
MARKILQWPDLPKGLPTELPLESEVSRATDKLLSLMDRDPLLKAVNSLIDRIPIIPEKRYPTPLGEYRTPEFYIPKIEPAKFDGRQREAFKAAVMQDLVWLASLIPGVSDVAEPVLDAVNDTADAKINDALNPDERKYFRSYNKVEPSSAVAMIKTMVRVEREP